MRAKRPNYTMEIVKKKKWWWRIRARNQKIICHSESYESKQNCLQTAHRLRQFIGHIHCALKEIKQ